MKNFIKKYKRYFFIARAKIIRKLARTRPHRSLPEQKYEAVKIFANRSGLKSFIETGTYQGDMLNAVKDIFNEMYSIELGIEFAQKAKKRFASVPHIHIVQGDSAKELSKVSALVQKPCLFWLDAHFSGDDARGNEITPVISELQTVLQRPYGDTILIDDARLFDGVDYPTIQRIKRLVRKMRPEYAFDVEDDIIRIYKNA